MGLKWLVEYMLVFLPLENQNSSKSIKKVLSQNNEGSNKDNRTMNFSRGEILTSISNMEIEYKFVE